MLSTDPTGVVGEVSASGHHIELQFVLILSELTARQQFQQHLYTSRYPTRWVQQYISRASGGALRLQYLFSSPKRSRCHCWWLYLRTTWRDAQSLPRAPVRQPHFHPPRRLRSPHRHNQSCRRYLLGVFNWYAFGGTSWRAECGMVFVDRKCYVQDSSTHTSSALVTLSTVAPDSFDSIAITIAKQMHEAAPTGLPVTRREWALTKGAMVRRQAQWPQPTWRIAMSGFRHLQLIAIRRLVHISVSSKQTKHYAIPVVVIGSGHVAQRVGGPRQQRPSVPRGPHDSIVSVHYAHAHISLV